MPSRPTIVRPSEAEDETVRERLEAAEDRWYGDAAFFGAMANCPPIFRGIVETLETFGQGARVDAELLELMRLEVADVHQCGYCATVRTLDVREAVAAKEAFVFGEVDPAGLTRREYLAVSLAEEMARDAHGITDERFAALREEFTEEEVVELLLFAALEVGLDRFCIALRLQPTDDRYPDEVAYPLSDPPRTE